MTPVGRLARIVLLSVAALLFGSEIVFSQVLDSQNIRSLPGPVSDQICTLSNTHQDVHYTVQLRDLIGDIIRPQQLDTEFEVSFVNACGENEWPAAAIEAFEFATELWAMHLDSSVPIRVEAFWENISPLGQATPTRIIHSSAIPSSEEDTWYTIAQASAMTGVDIVSVIEDEEFDIRIRLNCNVSNWYFGTDANPGGGQLDFVTVALHEIGHGIGFLGSMSVDANNRIAEWGIEFNNEPTPFIYDRFAEEGDGISLLEESIYPNPSNDLYEALTGMRGGVFFNGPESSSVFAGEPVPLFAPTPWRPGSSYSHVDQVRFTNTEDALMRPQIDQAFALHTPGPIFCGMLSDWGWPLGNGCEMMLDRQVFVEFSEDSLDFEFVNIGNFRDLSFFISNSVSANDPLTGRVEITGRNFSLAAGAGNFSLAPGESREVRVRYQPGRVGEQEGEVRVFHNAFNQRSPFQVNLVGEALERDVLVQLEQNFPNPFNVNTQTTQINYGLPQDSRVRLDLFDSIGRHVRTLVDEQQSAGRYEVILEPGDMVTGVYIYRIVVDNFVRSKKMMLVR